MEPEQRGPGSAPQQIATLLDALPTNKIAKGSLFRKEKLWRTGGK
jgi:hypothetical protein